MKSLSNLPIPLAEPWALFSSAKPYMYEKMQRVSADGFPICSVQVSARVGDTRRTLWVKIPMSEQPAVPVDIQVRLVGFTITFWSVRDRSGITLRALGLADVNGQLLAGSDA